LDDTAFEHGDYRKKKLQSLQSEGWTPLPSGKMQDVQILRQILFQGPNAVVQHQEDHHLGMEHMHKHRFVDGMFALDASAGPCRTVFEQSGPYGGSREGC
jgi:hypothetical protein